MHVCFISTNIHISSFLQKLFKTIFRYFNTDNFDIIVFNNQGQRTIEYRFHFGRSSPFNMMSSPMPLLLFSR